MEVELSPVALLDHGECSPETECVTTFWPTWFCAWPPGEGVEMSPWCSVRYEPSKKERRGNGSCHWRICCIAEIGKIGFQHLVITVPQGHSPNRVGYLPCGSLEVSRKLVVVGEHCW